MTCTLVYKFLFSRRADCEAFTSVPLDGKNREGVGGKSLKPKEEEVGFSFGFPVCPQHPAATAYSTCTPTGVHAETAQ